MSLLGVGRGVPRARVRRRIAVVALRMAKPAVLVLSDYYHPGFKGGGVVRTVENMVEHFGDQFCFRIVTAGRR